MKKQYIFLIMITIILYISYLIITFTYKEYERNSLIEDITNYNNEITNSIENWLDIIKYKSSKAYRNKVLKQQQSFKNKWEKVVYLTNEKKFNKFTKEKIEIKRDEDIEIIKDTFLDTMTIYEKWIYFLFKKDIR